MEILSIGDLMHLTRDELCALSQRVEQSLANFEAESADRANALVTLANIRRVMAIRDLSF
jgi:hypothetical protein